MKKQLPYFIFVFLVPVLAVLYWWGLFSSAKISVAERGNYHYAYIAAKGEYSKLANKQDEVLFELKKHNIKSGAQVTLMLSDPRSTKHDELLANTGYLVDESATLEEPLQKGMIPARKVVVAEIRAHPLFAYGKTYGALLDYCKKEHLKFNLPTFEIMQNSVLRVEMPIETTP